MDPEESRKIIIFNASKDVFLLDSFPLRTPKEKQAIKKFV